MKLLELVMIVKNSGELLRDCLRLNKKFIDHWTILDTGSSDNTKNIIKEELADIPGNLYEEDFVTFMYYKVFLAGSDGGDWFGECGVWI